MTIKMEKAEGGARRWIYNVGVVDNGWHLKPKAEWDHLGSVNRAEVQGLSL